MLINTECLCFFVVFMIFKIKKFHPLSTELYTINDIKNPSNLDGFLLTFVRQNNKI